MYKCFFPFFMLTLVASFNKVMSQSLGSDRFIWTMEAENLNYDDKWFFDNKQEGFLGKGYITWNGKDHFDEPGNGLISQTVHIPKSGIFKFLFRSKIGEREKSTDFNDTWIKIEGADQFYGKNVSDHLVFPIGSKQIPRPNGAGSDGWFKAYLAGSTYWTWSTNTSDDDGHNLFFEVDSPRDITLLLSARSRLHLIDKIAIYEVPNENPQIPKRYVANTQNESLISGELKRWHKVSLTFDGPKVGETSTPNPFMDYRLDVVFQHEDGSTCKVPGFYAACGEAAFNWCDEGNKWRVNFTPNKAGKWSWEASFVEGKDIAVESEKSGQPSIYINGQKGKFEVAKSDKIGKDFRNESLGRLHYVGEHFLRHQGINQNQPLGNWFIKTGADAPENTLNFEGFHRTPNRGDRRKNWNPHARDFLPWDSEGYNWGHDHGNNLLGMLSYMSGVGMNAISFLTFSASGDDENVFPHLMKIPDSIYLRLDKEGQWKEGLHHDRFDCSKLDQWEQFFSFADKKGIYLHFKLGEEENECKMDNCKLGRERKAYYREMIARFGHHLALNWNVGEENGYPIKPFMKDEDRIAAAQYINLIDPYHNHIVLHTRPDMKDSIYTPLLGVSDFTGVSLQSSALPVHDEIVKWISSSAQSGHKWIVTNDEQGSYQLGVSIDQDYEGRLPSKNMHKDNRYEVRHQVLWGTLMAGGAGVEYYYGYESGSTDLNSQDHRTRANKWNDAKNAKAFFQNYITRYIPNIQSFDDFTVDTSDFVLKLANHGYVIYQPKGKTISLSEDCLGWEYFWFDPIQGTESERSTFSGKAEPPSTSQDWVFLINKRNKNR